MKVTQLSSETLDRAHERFEETLALGQGFH